LFNCEKIYQKLEKWKTLTFSNEFVFDEKLISFFNEHVEKTTKDLKNICRLNECKVTGAKYKLISNICKKKNELLKLSKIDKTISKEYLLKFPLKFLSFICELNGFKAGGKSRMKDDCIRY
jgi:hypothetical protein